MTFGIREKISLLVVLATATSAFLVLHGVSTKSQEVLRQHEIVDLGDEASLRGWVLADRVDGLAEDLTNLAYNREFHQAVQSGESGEMLLELARRYCRRYWNDYLHIDIVHFGPETLDPAFTEIHSPVQIPDVEKWMPRAHFDVGAQLHLSPIRRTRVIRDGEGAMAGEETSEPVIWGIAPLNHFGFSLDGPQNFVRIASSVRQPPSPRHLFVLENRDGEVLQPHDDSESPGRGNSEVFWELSQDPLLLEALRSDEGDETTEDEQAQPRVRRLVKSEFVALKSPYYFLEGVPAKDLSDALQWESDDGFLDELRESCEPIGRIGSLNGGVRELRLFAESPERIAEIRRRVEEALRDRYGRSYDGVRWRKMVECDEIHNWAVEVLIGAGMSMDRYLIHYSVMEDELASSIRYEMGALRRLTYLIAGGAGAAAFLIAMFFIRPLKRMTYMAQDISKNTGDLHERLPGMINLLAIRRRDEVGDIARASKRLFEEIIAAYQLLEQRVAARTADLRKANFELEQANDQLKSLSHEKDAFVAKVSHDLRQPLNAIFLQVEALKLSDLDEVQREDVERIHSHATRELTLVNDILEYQKIIMGAETLHRDEVDLAAFAEELRETHAPSAGEKGLKLETQCRDAGVMSVDERRLRQVLGNLLSNAIKFTAEGIVRLTVEPRTVRGEDWVEFSVIDTGRGMSPEEQSRAFVPFVSNKKDNAGGTGLGLSICKELTERMGGRIGFVSELGAGTSFSVLMPRTASSRHYDRDPEPALARQPELAASAEEAARQIAEHAEAVQAGEGTILVIDDDPSVREMLRRLLEADGYEVITAADGDEGLEKARLHLPDVVTLDVVMPGARDGWAVLQALKDDPGTEGIPVIMLSIMAEADHGFALDVEDYLVKPVDVDRLSRVVSRVTRSSMQRNLLIVEDDVDSRELLARLLRESGWQSSFASNGSEALAVLKKTRPAAIVLDLMMPVMDGFEFLRIVQEDAELSSIPVIVVTGKEPTAEERAFLERRVGMILRKADPPSGEKLVKTITQRIRPGRPKR